jgi:uncharacterized protein YjiS (DUF1127 family)
MATHRLTLPTLATPSLPQTGLWRRLRTWLAVWNERRALAELDEHARRDLGLTEGIAAREANRPFWDIPSYR